jgi:hypothetical protein
MKNTLNIVEYIRDNLIFSIIYFFSYKNILFHNINSLGYAKSVRFLMLIEICLVCMGIIVHFYYGRNGISVFSNICIPFGIYTIMTYKSINKYLVSGTIVGALIISLYYVLVFILKNHGKIYTWKILKRSIIKCLCATHFVFSVGLAIIMGFYGTKSLLGKGIINSKVISNLEADEYKELLDDNISNIILLQEDKWENLTLQQKIDQLQVISDIECKYLGINKRINVIADNIGEYVMASYDEQSNVITINLDFLINNSADESIDSICHEVYHAYSHNIIYALESVPEQYKNLQLFSDAKIYQNEFNCYVSDIHKYKEYYNQKCEIDARNYAEKSVEYISSYIDDYSKKEKR